MTAATEAPVLAELRPARLAYRQAFLALLGRDLHLLRKSFWLFVLRTIMQPFLLVFVFTYVFPKIGQGVGGADSSDFATLLVAGVVGLAIIFQGIQAVALPLVQEFGVSKEMEDRSSCRSPTDGGRPEDRDRPAAGALRRCARVPHRRRRAVQPGAPEDQLGHPHHARAPSPDGSRGLSAS